MLCVVNKLLSLIPVLPFLNLDFFCPVNHSCKSTLIDPYLNLVKIFRHYFIIIIFAAMTTELLKDLRDRLMVLRRFL